MSTLRRGGTASTLRFWGGTDTFRREGKNNQPLPDKPLSALPAKRRRALGGTAAARDAARASPNNSNRAPREDTALDELADSPASANLSVPWALAEEPDEALDDKAPLPKACATADDMPEDFPPKTALNVPVPRQLDLADEDPSASARCVD